MVKPKDPPSHAEEEEDNQTILTWEFDKIPLNSESNATKDGDEPEVIHHLDNGKDIYENSLSKNSKQSQNNVMPRAQSSQKDFNN